MDPKLLERRRIQRLNSEPKIPKGLYLWAPSEELSEESLTDFSSDSEQKTLKKLKKPRKKQKSNKKDRRKRAEAKDERVKRVKGTEAKDETLSTESDSSPERKTKSNKIQNKETKAATSPLEKKFVGPLPAPVSDIKTYGSGLYHGEGEAIATFVQKGMRIPRRGEVGLTSNQIEDFEKLGYVMSGSRHKIMNAIRIRKENQVYSAEEKKALSVINFEEKAQREKKILNDMKKFLRSRVSVASKSKRQKH